jgi:hypothetical protein
MNDSAKRQLSLLDDVHDSPPDFPDGGTEPAEHDHCFAHVTDPRGQWATTPNRED